MREPGEATPFYIHALTVNSYMESAWRCLDGGSQISKILAQNILAAGGLVIKNREVKKLNTGRRNDNRPLLLSDGSMIQANRFISNTTPAATYRMTDSPPDPFLLPVKEWKTMQTTVSSFILNIVFKKNHFPYFKHNYYYHNTGICLENGRL